MKKLYIVLLLKVMLISIHSHAQTDKSITSKPNSAIPKTVAGIITHDNNCSGITLWKNITSGSKMMRVYNLQLRVSTVRNVSAGLGQIPASFPDKLLSVQTSFEAVDANSVQFKISDIPASLSEVYIELVGNPGLNATGIYDSIRITQTVISLDGKEKKLTIYCSQPPK